MRKPVLFYLAVWVATASFAGFNAKVIKPKQPQKFQTRTTVSGITFAADLLLSEKEQTEFFAKALIPNKIIALRLAIFNDSPNEVLIPLDGIQLLGPDGKELPPISPEAVAQTVL